MKGKENAKNEGKGNADKPDKAQGKPEDKGNKGQGSLNAAEHKQKIIEVVGNLNAVSDEEEEVSRKDAREEVPDGSGGASFGLPPMQARGGLAQDCH